MRLYGLFFAVVCFSSVCFAQQSVITDYSGYLAVSGTVDDNVIIATEENGRFVVRITDKTANGSVQQEQSWDRSYVKRFTVNALEGDNIIENNTSVPSWLIVRGRGTNRLIGGSSQDFLSGSDGDDYMEGNAGNDALGLSYGVDYGDGGPGNDYIVGEPHDTIIRDAGDTVIIKTLPPLQPLPPETDPPTPPSEVRLALGDYSGTNDTITFGTVDSNDVKQPYVRTTLPDKSQFFKVVNNSGRSVSVDIKLENASGVTLVPSSTVHISSNSTMRYQLIYNSVGFKDVDGSLTVSAEGKDFFSLNLKGLYTFASDVSYDGTVNLTDIGIVVAHQNNYHVSADVNVDGKIDEKDIETIQREYRAER